MLRASGRVLLPRATRGSAGRDAPHLGGEQLPPSPTAGTCQGVSPSLSSFSSITGFNADCRTPHPRGAAAPPRAPSSPDPPERGDTAAGGAGGRVPPALPARVPPPGAAGLSQPAPQPREGGMLHRAGVARRAPRPGPSTARVKPPGKRGDTKEN